VIAQVLDNPSSYLVSIINALKHILDKPLLPQVRCKLNGVSGLLKKSRRVLLNLRRPDEQIVAVLLDLLLGPLELLYE
jgi:hypothetical protein